MLIPFANAYDPKTEDDEDEARLAEIIPIESLDRAHLEAAKAEIDAEDDGPWIA